MTIAAPLVQAGLVFLAIAGFYWAVSSILRRRGEVSSNTTIESAARANPLEGAAVSPPPLAAEQLPAGRRSFGALAQALSLLQRVGAAPRLALRGDTIIVLLVDEGAAQAPLLLSSHVDEAFERIDRGAVREVLLRRLHRSGRLGPPVSAPKLLALLRSASENDRVTLHAALQAPGTITAAQTDYFLYLETLSATPGLIDFIYPSNQGRSRAASSSIQGNPPFDEIDSLPKYRSSKPNRRSVLLVHNNYYHFNVLSEALRRRGWLADTVSWYANDNPQRIFMHGEDINLHHPDPDEMKRRVRAFFQTVPDTYGVVHFYAQGVGTLFLENVEVSADPVLIPWDFMELRRRGVIIGHCPTGCLDGPRPASIYEVSGGLCDHCKWQDRPDVCSAARNGAWGRKLESICDWVGVEGDYAVDERAGPKGVLGPVVTTIDPVRWRPGLEPPDDLRIARERPDEILVYHAFADYEARKGEGRDIKGTGAVLAAVKTLQAEGFPIRLIFATNIPSTQVRFLQAQADVVVDQLNYGRHGANAREALMLGKPVIARKHARQGAGLPPLAYIEESPAVHATEDTITDVLRDLLLHRERWRELGDAGRAFALKWHGDDACAERFERVIDRIDAGLLPDAPELYP